ncbi:hypothetical protein CHARACLAT_001318 [Characodon lateralis]|uniref:Uncharacterized protein n=1 Tax=Characodon lateralis TaxID=208331 RepID=A0ABU7EPY8_9TELE|nr:hypothetical protein [Characodon lateralis]
MEMSLTVNLLEEDSHGAAPSCPLILTRPSSPFTPRYTLDPVCRMTEECRGLMPGLYAAAVGLCCSFLSTNQLKRISLRPLSRSETLDHFVSWLLFFFFFFLRQTVQVFPFVYI